MAATRENYLGRFEVLADAVAFEDQVLSIGREFLPSPAQHVLDGGEPTGAYWEWLCAQESEARD
jgi:hypothetical protein